MLFLNSEDVTRIWKQIVTGVIDNRLGCTCKVATDDGNNVRLSEYVRKYASSLTDLSSSLRLHQEL